MKISLLALPVALLALALGACSINQNVTPATAFDNRQICVVTNPQVLYGGFLTIYRDTLQAKGYDVRELPAGASLSDCPVTSTYIGNWRWDLAMYMIYAQIKVYSEGRQIGEATYDARRGGANLGKFIHADDKIRELVNQLFPNGPAGPGAIQR